MNRAFSFLTAAALAILSSCTLAPEYKRPASPVPAGWPAGAAYRGMQETAETPPAVELPWQEFITDSKIRQILTLALENNRDLRTAALSVERARAIYGIQRAELIPSVSASGSGSRERIVRDLPGLAEPMITEHYSAHAGISDWEIDFFGRLQSLKDRALEQYLATEQARRSTQILLVSSVANACMTLAADRENLKLAQATLETQRSAFRLIERRFQVGLATELTLRQAQTRVEAARVDAALYTRLVAQDENALNLLTGVPVAADMLPGGLAEISPPREISAGLSSEVLLLRPDVLQAENLLKAANANIGAARAAFFPRISLTTAVGTASTELSGLFKTGSFVWNFTPQAVLPIFDARIWAAAEAVKVEREIMLAQYEKSIQTAFREAADALAAQGTLKEQLAAQQALVDATAETYRLAESRYLAGIDSYLTVLDAQRSLYAAQQGLTAVRLLNLANQTRLYAVLGGGC